MCIRENGNRGCYFGEIFDSYVLKFEFEEGFRENRDPFLYSEMCNESILWFSDVVYGYLLVHRLLNININLFVINTSSVFLYLLLSSFPPHFSLFSLFILFLSS